MEHFDNFLNCIILGESSDVMKTVSMDTTQNIVSAGELQCQEKLSQEEGSAMGNTKSFNNTQNLDAQEIVINTVNDNIKKISLHPEYKSNEKCQQIVQQVLNIIVDASDTNELCDNISNHNLQMFINPLSQSDIRNLVHNIAEKQGDATMEIIQSVSVHKEAEDKDAILKDDGGEKIKSVVIENVRILKKSPSFSHDNISQMSVKLVHEILEKATTDEDIRKKLDHYHLGYFSKSDKTEFWAMREESLNRIVMETLEEDEEDGGECSEERPMKEESKSTDNFINEEEDIEVNKNSTCDNLIIDGDSTNQCREQSENEANIAFDENKEQIITEAMASENMSLKEAADKDAEVQDNLSFDDSKTIKDEQSEGHEVKECVDEKSHEKNQDLIVNVAPIQDNDEDKEIERTNLITVINKNISKICKEQDYNMNETAQRKVRTLFNIITESTSAEEILDKIQLEGLQYFAELEVKEKIKDNESRSPSLSRSKTNVESDSIVSKILSEVSTPSTERKKSELHNLSKSVTVGEVIPKKEVTICTLNRNKASRKVKKFRASKSSTSIDQIGISSSSDSHSRSSESDSNIGSSAEKLKSKTPPEILTEFTEIHQAIADSSDPISGDPEEHKSEEGTVEESKDLLETDVSRKEIELTPEMIERKQETMKAQKNFTEALRDSKIKRDKRKKKVTTDENSIVSRILGEVGNKDVNTLHKTEESQIKEDKDKEVPMSNPCKDEVDIITATNFEQKTKREKTISVCSDSIPDLCPVEEEGDLNICEKSIPTIECDDYDDVDTELDETIGSIGSPCPLSKKNMYKSGSIFFMTDFDEEEDVEVHDNDKSDEESFADANEHLSSDENMKIKPVVKEILSNALTDAMSSTENPEKELDIEKVTSNLLSPITNLVKTIVDEKLTSTSSKGVSPMINTENITEDSIAGTMSSTEKEIKEDSPIEKEDFDTSVEVFDVELKSKSVVGECETDIDAFDITMKRLAFIENSFKTSVSEENSSVPAIEHIEDSIQDKLYKIQQVLKHAVDSDAKIKLIEDIMNSGSSVVELEDDRKG